MLWIWGKKPTKPLENKRNPAKTREIPIFSLIGRQSGHRSRKVAHHRLFKWSIRNTPVFWMKIQLKNHMVNKNQPSINLCVLCLNFTKIYLKNKLPGDIVWHFLVKFITLALWTRYGDFFSLYFQNTICYGSNL